MQKIAVLLPTYGRADRLEKLINNFTSCSTQSNLYFIVDPNDKPTLIALTDLVKVYDFDVFSLAGEYVKAINTGVARTKEPFIFCGADDIEFSRGWDEKLLKVMENQEVNVTGGIDDWTCSRSGVHISHPLVRRKYIDEVGASFGGEKGILYHAGYKHYQCDIELEQMAWARNCFKLCKEVTIAHNHFINHQAKDDHTYRKSRLNIDKDTNLYSKRKVHFEFWDMTKLHQGIAQESEFRKKKLSIVMPIWNCKDYVIKTMESLVAQTKHKYELILLDDASTEFDGAKLLDELEKMAYDGGFITVKKVVNKEQKYCNFNWNKGVELSTGNYIAVINSDIEFLTEEWDDYLIENIDLGYELVNPYQKDHIYPERPYAKAPNKQDVNSRMEIRGACYMMSKEFAKKVFPIPSKYQHWCGDNWIAYHAKDIIFDIRVVILHYISKSGAKVDQCKFWQMVKKDVENWHKFSGEEIATLILKNCERNIAYHCKTMK